MRRRSAIASFRDDLGKAADRILARDFELRRGRVVPATKDVGFDEAVTMSATFLFADLMDSSGLVQLCRPATVGKVLRLYLALSVRVIRKRRGVIRSFDGDRVMAVFIGDRAAEDAVRVAMEISWVCSGVIQPKINRRYPSISRAKWLLRPATGIATGPALIVRGGVRNGSDLVAVGEPPNLAAKLSDIRSTVAPVRVDRTTYVALPATLARPAGADVWTGPRTTTMGGKKHAWYWSSCSALP